MQENHSLTEIHSGNIEYTLSSLRVCLPGPFIRSHYRLDLPSKVNLWALLRQYFIQARPDNVKAPKEEGNTQRRYIKLNKTDGEDGVPTCPMPSSMILTVRYWHQQFRQNSCPHIKPVRFCTDVQQEHHQL